MILIYPSDPSTKFLNEIVVNITKLIESDINKVMPDEYTKALDFIDSKEDSETILFLGHGYSGGLYGGCYVASGKRVLITKEMANKIFINKKVILFACRSSELIEGMNEVFNVAIGFGNIKTSKEDLISQREKKKYRDYRSLKIFSDKLVELFSNSITESIIKNHNFLQFYNALKLRINKSICDLSLSDGENNRLAGELMFELKREILLLGDKSAKLLEVN